MSQHLEGRTVLVTGAARGIGAACARRLTAAGARVVLADVDGPGVEKLAAELGQVALAADVTRAPDIARLVDEPYRRWGRLDVLFNNAGVGAVGSAHDEPLEQWDRVMQVDYAPYHIRVNALMPGTIHTPLVERYLRENYSDYAKALAGVRARQLTGELGQPEDVAAAALFLASDESRLVMGAGLIVDGGLTAGR